MKVVACEKCGAKYQIDDDETIDGYECSICAGNLKELDGDSSNYSSINQNHSNNLYKSSYDSDSQIVYCENCGLKHTLDKGKYAEEYECSSCFGNLRYVDEDLNKDLMKRLKLKQGYVDNNSNNNNNLNNNSNNNNNPNNNSNIVPNTNTNLENKTKDNNNPNTNINTENNTKHENNLNTDSNTKNKTKQNTKHNTEINTENKTKDDSKSNTDFNTENKINNDNRAVNKSDVNSDQIQQSTPKSIPQKNKITEDDTEKKLRNQIKNEFFDSLDIEYDNNHKPTLKNDKDIHPEKTENTNDIHPEKTENTNDILPEKTENTENIIKKEEKDSELSIFDKISNQRKKREEKEKESNLSIFDKIANRREKKKEKERDLEKKALEKEIAELNNPSKPTGTEINIPVENKDKEIENNIDKEIKNNIDKEIKNNKNKEIKNNKNNRKQELVPYPNIKNTSYHDVYIIVGLIIALIGFADIISSQRVYSIIFIAIGIILFIIGIIKNNTHSATEKRGRIIREKLLGLPENFYVLYYVKVPNSNYGINHVVVGASGIFSIVSQSYGEKEDKEKPKTDTENLNLVNKSKLDDFDLLGISDLVEEANNNYENNKRKSEEAQNKIENKRKKVGKFKFRETPIKFDHNNKIKQKSIQLSEELIDFLNENGLKNFYVEPLVGFVNNDVAVINMPLTDEDLFLDELLYRIVHGRRQLDDISTHKIAVLLSQYSTECSS